MEDQNMEEEILLRYAWFIEADKIPPIIREKKKWPIELSKIPVEVEKKFSKEKWRKEVESNNKIYLRPEKNMAYFQKNHSDEIKNFLSTRFSDYITRIKHVTGKRIKKSELEINFEKDKYFCNRNRKVYKIPESRLRLIVEDKEGEITFFIGVEGEIIKTEITLDYLIKIGKIEYV